MIFNITLLLYNCATVRICIRRKLKFDVKFYAPLKKKPPNSF